MQQSRTDKVQKQSSMQEKESLIIVGNGMATGRLLDEILKRDPEKYQITVIGAEPQGSYNRIMLSSVLAGEVDYKEIIQKPKSWYKENNITLISKALVTDIQRGKKSISLDRDEHSSLYYDQLILAVGSRSAKIPSKNQNIAGIFNFRSITDTQKIEAFAASSEKYPNKRALVVGGGLLGLEAAYGLAVRGIKVVLIHRNHWLLNRQLDQESGMMLQNILEHKNIEFILGQEIVRFQDVPNSENIASICGVELTNGETVKVDMAIIATGITPNSELGSSAALEVNHAIMVDDFMQTSDPFISALGECCEHRNSTFGLVDPIWNQCEVLAERLTNNNFKKFKNSPVPTKLKVSGVQLFSAGVVESSNETQSTVMIDKKASVYRKLIIKNEQIVGIVLFGDVSSGMDYFDLMQNKQNVTNLLPELLIGSEFIQQEDADEAVEPMLEGKN